MEKPAFEVTDASGNVFRVYADGQIDGFAEPRLIINRIPQLLAEARAREEGEGE